MTSSTGKSGGSHALSQRNDNLGAVPFAKTRPVSKSSGNSQADQRRAHFMTDQHGRPWSCSIEIRSNMPTGLITNDFNAPWMPDQNALVVNPNDTRELWINYKLMWDERKQAMAAYHKNVVALCADKSWDVPAVGQYSNDVRRIVGEPPKPLQPIKAAAQGNPWILGFTDVVDERLYEYVTPIEDRDSDLDDGQDYSPEGFDAQVAQQQGLDDDAVEDRGPRAPVPFVRPVLDIDAMDDDSVIDYSADDDDDEALGAQGTDTLGDEDADDYAPRFPAGEDGGEESALSVLDDVHDRPAMGGRRIPPRQADVAQRQEPRSPSATSKPRKKAKSRGSRGRQMVSLRAKHAAQQGTKPSSTPRSLADGARPAVGAARSAGEVLVRHASEAGK